MSSLPSHQIDKVTVQSGLEFMQSHAAVTAGEAWRSTISPGLSIGLAVRGSLGVELLCSGRQAFDAPLGYVFAADHPIEVAHQARTNGPLVCTHLHIPAAAVPSLVEQSGPEAGMIDHLCGRPASCRFWAATPPLRAMAQALTVCPYDGLVRSLYLQGKAFEFLALTIQLLRDEGSRPVSLTGGDVERLHAARAILLQEFADPPALEALGRRVGMSVTRLTEGFRRLFGTSVVAFLQEHRLTMAHDALVGGRMTVAQAAYAAGYTPAAFSTLFRRRFGIPPSRIRARHL